MLSIHDLSRGHSVTGNVSAGGVDYLSSFISGRIVQNPLGRNPNKSQNLEILSFHLMHCILKATSPENLKLPPFPITHNLFYINTDRHVRCPCFY